MHIPSYFLEPDQAVLLDFMRRYPFGLLVSQHQGRPFGTHLPFVVKTDGSEVKLIAHVAIANPQWRTLTDQPTMVVFSEPHAYISPTLYENPVNVPTWNYVAVHAYGSSRICDEPSKLPILKELIETFEPAYARQLETLPKEYVERMLAGIVAIEIVVAELQGKRKLSQNKPLVDQQRIADHLMQSGSSVTQDIGAQMQLNLRKQPRLSD